MEKFFDTLYDVLFHPKPAMREIAGDKEIWQAVAVVIFSVLIPLWAVYFGLQTAGIYKAFSLVAILEVIGSLVMWVISASLWSFIAELFGGRGTAVGLFTALGFAHLPRVFIVPLWVAAALLPSAAGPLVMGITAIAVGFWTLYLDVAAIRESHDLTGAKAVLVLLAPILVLVAVIAVVITFAGAALLQKSWWL